jgi:membrane protein YdbS with pleckstrin-like domain
MALGWKFMIPTALAYVMVIAVASYVLEHLLGFTEPWPFWAAMTVLNVALAVVVFFVLDRGYLISGTAAYRRPTPAAREARAPVTS